MAMEVEEVAMEAEEVAMEAEEVAMQVMEVEGEPACLSLQNQFNLGRTKQMKLYR